MLAAIAEIAISQAIDDDRSHERDNAPVIARFLTAGRYAYEYLFLGSASVGERSLGERQTQVRDYYNSASERVGQLLFERLHRIDPTHVPRPGDTYQLADWTLTTGRMEVRAPLHTCCLEQVVPASALRFEGLRNVFRRDGFGAEFVTSWRAAAATDHDVTRSEIAYRPATVLLDFESDDHTGLRNSRQVRMHIFDPYQQSVVSVGGARVGLAGNFSAAYGLWLARSGFARQAVRNLLGSRSALDHAEIVMMQPYDPSRITIVLIHGLGGSPEAWVNVANEILGDERLRDRYQVWQVYYPTNVPVAISQLNVRQAIEETLDAVDPGRLNAASRDIVLIGHSMGGIIARLLISRGGERIWDERYHAPPGSERRARLARLEPYLDFHPMAGVDRVIFLATPHQGTPYAANWISRRVAGFVHLPATLLELVDSTAASIEGDLPEAARTLRQHPNGINLLDPRSPYLELTSKLEIAPGIPYHSIIGRKSSQEPLESSSDGIVPYTSAYLPGAESTLVVASDHHVQERPEAIREIRRILLAHAATHQ